MKKYTIETSYSKETYYCNDIENFLYEICFCDEWEVIEEEKAEQEKINLFNETIEALKQENIKIDEFWNNQVLLLLSEYYENYNEMILDNKECI